MTLYEDESIYAMGNPYELEDSECELVRVLMEKLTESKIPKDDDSNETITDKIRKADTTFVDMLLRPCEEGDSLKDTAKKGDLLID